jgi:hypothetical protein
MQNWEYMTAQFTGMGKDNLTTDDIMVYKINGHPTGNIKYSISGISKKGGELLEKFLSRVGAEGWEAVTSNNLGDSNITLIILKRPVQ